MQNCEAKFDQDLFPEKIPKVWRETKIKACFFPVPPYTTSCSNATICEKRGYEFELLELIWGMMNVSWYYSQYEYPGNDYNEVDHQKLLDRKCDIILKQFIHLDLDCIYAYIQYNYHWIVPTAGQIPRWKYVIGIFSKELWLLWIITFVILCLAWYIVDLVVDKRKNKTEFQRKIFILASLSVDSPQNLNFKYLSEGFLIIAIIFFTWIMSLIYRSRFPFLLAGVNYEKGIDTVQDIMKHNLMIGSIIYEIAEAQFSNIGPEAVDYLNSHFVTYCDFGDYCTQQVAYNRNMAVVKSSTQFASFQKDYINKDGRYLIKKLDPPLTKFHIGSNMIKGHPLFPRINNFVLLLEDLGIKRHIVSPYESPTLKSPSSLGIHKLDLDHILAPLVMWVVGLFPEKIPNVWRDTKIKACFFPVPPYTSSCTNAAICRKRGYEFEILELIWSMMNVSWYYSQYEYPGNDYDEVDHQKLLDRKCDVILKQFIHLDLDCTYPYVQYNYHWVVPTAGQIPRWKYVIGIFSKELWIFWMITSIILCVVWYFADTILNKSNKKSGIQKILILTSLSVDSPQPLNFSYSSEGIVITSIIFFTWIMSLIYRCRFPFLLAGVNYEKGIDTIQDIMKHNLMIGSVLFEIAKAQFVNIGPEAVDYFNSHFVTYCDFGDYCTQQLAFNRNIAIVKSSTQFASFQKDYINEDGRYLLKKLDPPLTKFQVGANMIKGHPLSPRMNEYVLLLDDFGIKQHIMSGYETQTMRSPSSLGTQKLDFDHILAPSFIWGVGMCLSSVVFMLEQLMFKIHAYHRQQEIENKILQKIS
ncbi:hypothetical protein HHI36_020525 [Cryptolaemus montrouzieri]|uniref:Uncharacterized protein n=1 Tax=Cryptolaemus montrouzieri TaxID=559131 RepID=A0ABD2NBJ7_9CUCU